MEDTNSSIFTYAKAEYTTQLIDMPSPQLYDGMKSIYDEAVKAQSKISR